MSVTAASGFVAAGLHCGVKASGVSDLALVATDDAQPVPTAGVFTPNLAAAAPVRVTRAHLAASRGRAAAVVLNSGNANAATGAAGVDHAECTCRWVAEELDCRPEEVLVCSTGLIGIPLPIDAIEAGVPALAASRSSTAPAGLAAATAIMTTDTVPKQVVVHGDGFVVGGMAKGAAMLAPDMATMLAVLTTDATVSPPALQAALVAAVAPSFNALTVDGCTSTNDSVIVLAGARAGREVGGAEIGEALTQACVDLAAQISNDAEGATKVVTIRVAGARSDTEAATAARKVAQSQLVKCSLYGRDPYWGRVVSELGTAGVGFDLDRVTVSYGGVMVCRGGVAVDHDVAALAKVMAERHLTLTADLGLGTGQGVVVTNDLTHAYIDENVGTS